MADVGLTPLGIKTNYMPKYKAKPQCDGIGRATVCSGDIVEKYKVCGETMRFCEKHSNENAEKRKKYISDFEKL